MGSGAPTPLYLSLLISWVVGALLTSFAYARGSWKKKIIVSVPAGTPEVTAEVPLEPDTVADPAAE